MKYKRIEDIRLLLALVTDGKHLVYYKSLGKSKIVPLYKLGDETGRIIWLSHLLDIREHLKSGEKSDFFYEDNGSEVLTITDEV